MGVIITGQIVSGVFPDPQIQQGNLCTFIHFFKKIFYYEKFQTYTKVERTEEKNPITQIQ